MQGHYADAVRAHDAVVRGDLAGAREAARRVEAHPESGLPEKAAPFAAALQQAASRVAQAGDISAGSARPSASAAWRLPAWRRRHGTLAARAEHGRRRRAPSTAR
jgi:hypothetical protein